MWKDIFQWIQENEFSNNDFKKMKNPCTIFPVSLYNLGRIFIYKIGFINLFSFFKLKISLKSFHFYINFGLGKGCNWYLCVWGEGGGHLKVVGIIIPLNGPGK